MCVWPKNCIFRNVKEHQNNTSTLKYSQKFRNNFNWYSWPNTTFFQILAIFMAKRQSNIPKIISRIMYCIKHQPNNEVSWDHWRSANYILTLKTPLLQAPFSFHWMSFQCVHQDFPVYSHLKSLPSFQALPLSDKFSTHELKEVAKLP